MTEIFEDTAKMVVAVAFLMVILGALTVPALGNALWTEHNLAYAGINTFNDNSFLTLSVTNSSNEVTVYFKINATDTTAYANFFVYFNATYILQDNFTYDKVLLTFDNNVSLVELEFLASDGLISWGTSLQKITVGENGTSFEITYNLGYIKANLNTKFFVIKVSLDRTKSVDLYADLNTMHFSFGAFDTSALVNYALILMVVSVVFSMIAKQFKLPDVY